MVGGAYARRMASSTCVHCGRSCPDGACVHCDGRSAAATPGLLAMPGDGDSAWTRVALVATALVTVAIAAGMLYLTVRGFAHRA